MHYILYTYFWSTLYIHLCPVEISTKSEQSGAAAKFF